MRTLLFTILLIVGLIIISIIFYKTPKILITIIILYTVGITMLSRMSFGVIKRIKDINVYPEEHEVTLESTDNVYILIEHPYIQEFKHYEWFDSEAIQYIYTDKQKHLNGAYFVPIKRLIK